MGIFFVNVPLGSCRVYISAVNMGCTWGKHFRDNYKRLKKRRWRCEGPMKSRQASSNAVAYLGASGALGEPKMVQSVT